MNCVITKIENIDQRYVLVYVSVLHHTIITHMHVLEFEARVFVGLSSDEKVDIVKRALREKLTSELNLSDLIGEQFTLDTLYHKAYA